MKHSIRAHIVAPIWLRLPQRTRWAVVRLLNRSNRRCWSSLVDDALPHREQDMCDVRVPSLRGNNAERCASVCDWAHPLHEGEHDCSCYCGKFRFTATESAARKDRSDV